MPKSTMKWSSQFSVGIEEIDRQHRELIDLFNRVVDTIKAADHWADVHFRLLELRNFAGFHFEFEEGLMRMFAYPGREDHAGEHSVFFQRLDSIERSAISANVKAEVIKFLFDWLTHHISGSDRGYAKHLLDGAGIVGAD